MRQRNMTAIRMSDLCFHLLPVCVQSWGAMVKSSDLQNLLQLPHCNRRRGMQFNASISLQISPILSLLHKCQTHQFPLNQSILQSNSRIDHTSFPTGPTCFSTPKLMATWIQARNQNRNQRWTQSVVSLAK